MKNILLKRYEIYEYMRDNECITSEISNTKKLIKKLIEKDEGTIAYCKRKILEEKKEIEEAKIGNHFHANMTKREILVNEISQYLYWLTIIAVSDYVSYNDFKCEEKLDEILKEIDVNKIGEERKIEKEEVIYHDLDEMKMKEYLKEVIDI